MNKIVKPPQLCIDRSEEFAKLVVDRHPEYIERYKTQKSIVAILMAEAMKECRGSVNPGLMREAIIEELETRSE